MPCICSPEGQEDADALRAKAKEIIGFDSDKNFVSNMVATLWWEYNCEITGVYMDMWFGVVAENETEKFFVPCDKVEDGLAVIWEYHYNKGKPNGSDE